MRADEIFARANNEHTFGQQQTSISQKLKKKTRYVYNWMFLAPVYFLIQLFDYCFNLSIVSFY